MYFCVFRATSKYFLRLSHCCKSRVHLARARLIILWQCALSFFSVGETVTYQGNELQAQVSLIFFVNLAKINPSTERADELTRQQIIQMVQGSKAFGFSFTGVETGLDSVMRDYDGIRKSQGVKYRDTHPFHCFKLNFELRYKSNYLLLFIKIVFECIISSNLSFFNMLEFLDLILNI